MEKHGLPRTIDQLVRNAEAEPGKARRINLLRGLRVDVKLLGDQLYVQLSREKVYPSEREWQIVIRVLPYLVDVEPAKFEYEGRFYLRGHWRHIRERQKVLDG